MVRLERYFGAARPEWSSFVVFAMAFLLGKTTKSGNGGRK